MLTRPGIYKQRIPGSILPLFCRHGTLQDDTGDTRRSNIEQLDAIGNPTGKYPLVMSNIAIETSHLVRGCSHQQWWFSSSLCKGLPEGRWFSQLSQPPFSSGFASQQVSWHVSSGSIPSIPSSPILSGIAADFLRPQARGCHRCLRWACGPRNLCSWYHLSRIHLKKNDEELVRNWWGTGEELVRNWGSPNEPNPSSRIRLEIASLPMNIWPQKISSRPGWTYDDPLIRLPVIFLGWSFPQKPDFLWVSCQWRMILDPSRSLIFIDFLDDYRFKVAKVEKNHPIPSPIWP